jgi:ABC-2 type transport system permease protein
VFAPADARTPATEAGGPRQPSAFRHYRHLTLELAVTQFKLRYTKSALGYAWSLLKPAMLFGITYVIFVDLFHVEDGTPDYGIQLLLGIVTWTFFAECTAASMQAIAGSGGLIRKAYFPRSILVIAASLSSVFTFLINLTLVALIAVLLHQIDFGLRMLVVIPLLVELYFLVLGISLFLSALFVQYHDVGHIWEVLMQLLFYGSGVMFSLTYVLQRAGLAHRPGTAPTAPHFLWAAQLLAANPIMQIIEDLRHALVTPVAPWTASVVTGHLVALGQTHPLHASLLLPVPFLLVLLIFAGGALTFRSRARTFAEDL